MLPAVLLLGAFVSRFKRDLYHFYHLFHSETQHRTLLHLSNSDCKHLTYCRNATLSQSSTCPLPNPNAPFLFLIRIARLWSTTVPVQI